MIVCSRLMPALGAVPLCDVTPATVRHYLQSDAATRRMDGHPGNVSPRHLQLQYLVLRAALEDAVHMELLPRNPAVRVPAPRAMRTREPRRLTFEELAVFLSAAEQASPRYAALFRLAATTGLRVGSLLALRWDDVDWQRSALRVRVAKTVTSLQSMPLDDDTMEALRAHQDRQEQERAAAGPFWRDEGWVFANEEGGAPRYRQVAQRELRRIVAAAGIGPVRMHDLRHTAGSRMLEAGIDARTVADRLGHRDAAFFLRTYAGSLPASHRRAADVMGEGLRKAGKGHAGRRMDVVG
ncbi:MAG: site-specific integrase [Actinomycetota bacterium]|nr:site-specific integrase [Actinomycetota bacterium]